MLMDSSSLSVWMFGCGRVLFISFLASNIDFPLENLNSFNFLQAGKLLLDLAATGADTQNLKLTGEQQSLPEHLGPFMIHFTFLADHLVLVL